MKKILTALVVLAMSASAIAQPKDAAQRGQKMESDKVAYISTRMNLTVQEAEKFWPVYNKIVEEQKAQMQAVREAKKALRAATKKEEGKELDQENISKCLKAYVDAQKKVQNVPIKYYAELTKVLSAEKVAKYYMAEDSFRTQQIKKMRGAGPKQPRPEGRPEAPKEK